ncbi:MAG: YqgE/AlgH family protein [Flavobacteriales bacterium]
MLAIMKKKTSFLFENQEEPSAGGFLLSDPFMGDPYFERSVVYLCQHDQEGTFGMVLNNPLGLHLQDVIDQPFPGDFPLFIGGPVARNQLFFLHDQGDTIEGSLPITEQVSFSGDFDSLVEHVTSEEKPKLKVKFFVGYSGWDEGQLEREIKEHSWIAVNNLPSPYVFSKQTEKLWTACMELQGPKFKTISRFPKNPNEN